MDEQRKRVYGYRQRILDGVNCKQLIIEMMDTQIDEHLDDFPEQGLWQRHVCRAGPAVAWAWSSTRAIFAAWSSRRRPRVAKDEAARLAESQVIDAIEENLPEDEDPKEWNWEALAKLLKPALAVERPRPRAEEDRAQRTGRDR